MRVCLVLSQGNSLINAYRNIRKPERERERERERDWGKYCVPPHMIKNERKCGWVHKAWLIILTQLIRDLPDKRARCKVITCRTKRCRDGGPDPEIPMMSGISRLTGLETTQDRSPLSQITFCHSCCLNIPLNWIYWWTFWFVTVFLLSRSIESGVYFRITTLHPTRNGNYWIGFGGNHSETVALGG